MVSQNEGPRRPKKPGKPNSDGLSPEDLAKAESALSQEFLAQLKQAIELGRAGDFNGAAELSRKAIKASEAKGGIHEASVILAFLPTLFPGAEPDESLKLAHRVADLSADWPGCDYLTSHARFFAMKAQLKADRKLAALEEAETCVVAGKASKTHCKWLATAWRYYGMLLAVAGRMPEALMAISNSIDLAKKQPPDDPLALARGYDAIGRTLLEVKETARGMESLRRALEEYRKKGRADTYEAKEVMRVLGLNSE
jgi:tetratricopeptide (TPR) repeat protein